MFIKFIGVVCLFILFLISISFLWPRFRTEPRPEALRTVHDFVASTSVGPQISEVLGVSSEKDIRPINIPQMTQDAVGGAVASVEMYTKNLLFRETTRQLSNQLNNLTPDQKNILTQLVCEERASASDSALGTTP